MKKLFVFLSVFSVCVVMLSAAALAEHSGSAGNTAWSISDSGKLTITGSGEMNREAASYSSGWKKYGEEIKTVEIGDGITSICFDAFSYCDNITAISIPASVERLDVSEYNETPFNDLAKLRTITVDSGNQHFTVYGGVLFNKSKSTLIFHPPARTETSYTIPSSVTRIGDDAFYESENLTSVTIPGSVTYIGDGAFVRSSLSGALTIPDSVTYLGAAAFEETNITSVKLPAGLTKINDYLFSTCDSLESITLPGTVTSIGDNAFFWCEKLPGIDIPDGVEYIGQYAFCGCTGFTSISIPDSVFYIGSCAFTNCTGLADSGGFVIVDNTLFGYFGTKTDVTVPQSVITVGTSAFVFGQYTLTGDPGPASVTLPATVFNIDTQAFKASTLSDTVLNLKEVKIYNSRARFGEGAFALPAEALSGLVISGWPDSTASVYAASHNIRFRPLSVPDPDLFLPSSLTAIPKYAFTGISAKAVVIPESVSVISANPFSGSSIKAVYGYEGSAAQTFADKYGYYFVPIDDAWMESHK